MNINNQKEYWDKVAEQKTFTHPINIDLLLQFADKDAYIIDYGCGYGRIVEELTASQFSNVAGYDTSVSIIQRGKKRNLPIHHIADSYNLPLENNSVDCILLFAVLTCVPSNKGQLALIQMLQSKLKPGGVLYISDYYLQNNEVSKSRYTGFENEQDNFGVFTIPEGATFRHHTKKWIATLFADFTIECENRISVKTMNGNTAEAFQLIVRK
jgi:SAM-dependent methyltransferase